MSIGYVKWWNINKGWGFIEPDIFVPVNSIIPVPDRVSSTNPNGFLVKGDQVLYDLTRSPRGTKAVNVKLVKAGY